MSDGTITVITVLLFVFALSAFVWPLALGVHLELEERKKRGEPPAYDERQKLARLRAGSHAMYTLLFFLVFWAVMDQIGWFDWTSSILDLVLCALMLAWCVWASDCIWHDAFITWKDKRKDADILGMNYSIPMMFFVRAFCAAEITTSWVPFIFACANIVVLCIVVFCKYRRDKKAEKEGLL